MSLLEKFLEDIKKGNYIIRNFGERDEEFRKRVIEETLKLREEQ